MMLVETDIFGNTIDKVKMSIDRLREFEPPQGYYVAFSGGKDSVVILDLVRRSEVKYDAHYHITGIDPPELYYFIRDKHPEVERHRPLKTIWSLIEHKMIPPTRMKRYCCEVLKEHGGSGRIIVTGIRWAESNRRSKRKMTEACLKDKRKHYLNVIIDWSDDDIWEYIRRENVPYCKLYDEGFKRLGCIGCPKATEKNRIKEFSRWPRYAVLWERAFQRCVSAREKAGKNEFRRASDQWNSGKQMFDWWLHYKWSPKEAPDQTVMFE